MQYRVLGRTGVQVSTLALGAMNFGAAGRTGPEDAAAIVDAALTAGVNLIDTADAYSGGRSEELVGGALRATGRRDDVVLATKAGLPMGESRNRRGSSRRWLVTALDESLARLGVDHVDLFQVHLWDPTTDDEETLAALTDLRRAGKIRYFGASNFIAHRIVEAQWAAREHHLGRYVTEQTSYSVLQRGVEAHVLPVAEHHGLGVLCWSPLSSGWLSGAVRENSARRRDAAGHGGRFEAVEALAAIAEQAGLTLVQLALGFVTAHPAVSTALVGPRTPEHLRGQLAAADTVLGTDVLDAIDAVVAPGVDLAPAEKHDTSPALLDPRLRRR